MRKLVHRIKKELQTAKHCVVCEDQVNRVRRFDGKSRESEIARFAQDHGWLLRHYHDGFCAIFDKKPGTRGHRATAFDF
jgi:hypothetical protein